MTIRALYNVWCDQEGCNEWTDGGDSRAAAARAARRESWQHVGRWWYCPNHQADPLSSPGVLSEDPEGESAIEANSRRLDAEAKARREGRP